MKRTTLPYRDFGSWLADILPFKVQKLPINAGFTCPNRDGKRGRGGCSYCNNEAFTPSYTRGIYRIANQLAAGKAFFADKYPDMHYLAYLQAHTNTYNTLDHLKTLYESILREPNFAGIVIGTRPDCVDEQLLDYLQELSRHAFVIVEYGIESANDNTLAAINRGHDFECVRQAVKQTSERGIITCGHIILGLPGENQEESLRQAAIISALPLDILKIHQLQVIKGTTMAKQYSQAPFHLYSADEYIALLAEYIQRLRPDLVLERFVSEAPPRLLIAPRWGLKPGEFNKKLIDYMRSNQMWQGKKLQA